MKRGPISACPCCWPLYSIPTEAETAQKTSALSAGVIGRVDHGFLGWSHVTFPGGQAGWVRNDDLIMLWR